MKIKGKNMSNKSVVANKNFALIGEGGYVAPSMASKCAFS